MKADSHIFAEDGIWEDSFGDENNVTVIGGHVEGGEIVLNRTSSTITYDFNPQGANRAYAYRSIFFLPLWKYFSPTSHTSKEIEFGGNDYYRLKYTDEGYAERSSRGYVFSYVIQHFRIKIDIDPDIIDTAEFLWNGTADKSTRVNFYLYNYSYFKSMERGGWEQFNTISSSTGEYYSKRYNISIRALPFAVDGSNYIDICAVATHPIGRQICTLYTDCVSLQVSSEKGYSTKNATAWTNEGITPSDFSNGGFNWEFLTWDDYQPTNTIASYQVLYKNDEDVFVPVEKSVLPGNQNGFKTGPIYLNNLSNYDYHEKYNTLKIRVNFSTDSPSVSPRIFNWALTWQNKTRWQDTFETFYRIDTRTKVSEENGSIKISTIQDEWPMFGFDAANTRASGGKAATSANVYWFGVEYAGGQYCNPVVGNGYVYILSTQRALHQYQVVLPSGTEENGPLKNKTTITFDRDVVNSPAVTDELVIVATGQEAPKGTENFIYGFEPDNLSLQWTYDYGENICYDASPVIDGSNLFITAWGGDNDTYLLESKRYTNNKLLSLTFDTESIEKNWGYTLPAPSLSSPAVTADKVIVTCSGGDNDSVIAVDRVSGLKLWGQAVGTIGHASPVVSGNMVFVSSTQVTSKKYATKIVALNLDDGTILWNKTLGTPSLSYTAVADSTPAVYNGIIYAAAADGTIYALKTTNGTTVWSNDEIYSVPLLSKNVLRSSPAYAENYVYIGTPDGLVYALDASTGNEIWHFETFPDPWSSAPVYGSPAVTNGLVFIADEAGVLYSLGRFTTTTKQVSGSIISFPIRLPESLWWDKFYANYLVDKNFSSITFKLLDAGGTVLDDNLISGQSLTEGGFVLNRSVRLQADFTSSNLSKNNPTLFVWNISLTTDNKPPFINDTTFFPSTTGWLQNVVPMFTVRVKDNGTGLRVRSAVYTLRYSLNTTNRQGTFAAVCTGDNGTNAWQTMTMNISKIPDYNNITALRSITYNITDLAGNTASKTKTFKQDVFKPTSSITKLPKERYNTTNIEIKANANDTGKLNDTASDVKLVELYYRYSETRNFTGDWIYFSNSTKKSPTWLFNFTSRPSQHGGYYELCTIAIDNAGNNESFPATGDVWFLWDWTEPELPSYSGDTLWFKERPQFSVEFEDDYRLDTIQYRPNFETVWTTLVSDVNESVYDTGAAGDSWTLPQSYWDQMEEGEIYYLYFRINDTLGNTREILNDNQAITIRKDTSAPLVTIDVPSAEDEWSMSDNFTISGIGNDHEGSGIKDAILYYRYSQDNSNWSSWATFGSQLDSSPFEWNFDATKGDGYYEMKIIVTDNAGNQVESEVFPVAIASFPATLVYVLVGLVTVLVFLTVIIYLTRKKKESV